MTNHENKNDNTGSRRKANNTTNQTGGGKSKEHDGKIGVTRTRAIT
jgi:hypothetical protein